jgi:hypothetical protein
VENACTFRIVNITNSEAGKRAAGTPCKIVRIIYWKEEMDGKF